MRVLVVVVVVVVVPGAGAFGAFVLGELRLQGRDFVLQFLDVI